MVSTTAWSLPATATTTDAMLVAAHAGFWFHAPDSIAAQFPQFPATNTYDELFAAITGAL